MFSTRNSPDNSRRKRAPCKTRLRKSCGLNPKSFFIASSYGFGIPQAPPISYSKESVAYRKGPVESSPEQLLRISDIVRGKEFSDNVMYEQNSDTEPSRTETNQGAESAPAGRAEHCASRQSARLYPTTRVPHQSEVSSTRSGSDDAWQPREKECAAHQRADASAR